MLVALAATGALILLAAAIILGEADGGYTSCAAPEACILCLEELA